MRLLILISCLQLCINIPLAARTPQYYNHTAVAGNYFSFSRQAGTGSKVRLLYKPADIQAVSGAGMIHSIYFKTHGGVGIKTYRDFSISMAATGLEQLSLGNTTVPLTTVFRAPQYSMDFCSGEWTGPVTLRHPFSYDGRSNLLVEITVGDVSAVRYVGKAEFDRVAAADNTEGGLYTLGFDMTPAPPAKERLATAKKEQTLQVAVAKEQKVIQPQPANEGNKPAAFIKKQAKALADKLLLVATGALGLLCLAFLLPFLPKTTRAAYWTAKHPAKTKWLLVGSQFATSLTAFLLGKHLYDQGMVSSDITPNVLFATAATASLLYPSPRSSSLHFLQNYRRKKMLTLLMAIAGMGLMTHLGNHNAANKEFAPVITKAITAVDKEYYDEPLVKQAESMPIAGKKTPRPIDPAGATAIRILATIFLVVILIAVAIGSCLLICAEQPVWAALLLFGGGGGSIAGYIWGMIALNKAVPPRRRRHGRN